MTVTNETITLVPNPLTEAWSRWERGGNWFAARPRTISDDERKAGIRQSISANSAAQRESQVAEQALIARRFVEQRAEGELQDDAIRASAQHSVYGGFGP